MEVEALNAKAMSIERLYGFYNGSTREWVDGVLASTLRRLSESVPPSADGEGCWKWMVLDGPVDPNWVESLNTVLDDNKVLTLNNGDRVALSDDVQLLFEAEELESASPATVSRVGVVYVDAAKLEWRSVTTSWLAQCGLSQRGRDCVAKLLEQVHVSR